jgi:F-type H+-transporting ATPase subunit epsilon
MADTLRLRVVTPERLLLDEEVNEVTAPGTVGEFGVLPHHITFLSSLRPGCLTYKQGARARTLAIGGGFAEVVNDVMTVLADSAEFAEEIDLEEARRVLRVTEARLQQIAINDPGFVDVELAHLRARARVEAAGRGGAQRG